VEAHLERHFSDKGTNRVSPDPQSSGRKTRVARGLGTRKPDRTYDGTVGVDPALSARSFKATEREQVFDYKFPGARISPTTAGMVVMKAPVATSAATAPLISGAPRP